MTRDDIKTKEDYYRYVKLFCEREKVDISMIPLFEQWAVASVRILCGVDAGGLCRPEYRDQVLLEYKLECEILEELQSC